MRKIGQKEPARRGPENRPGEGRIFRAQEGRQPPEGRSAAFRGRAGPGAGPSFLREVFNITNERWETDRAAPAEREHREDEDIL